jgi:hypothetical protein
VNDNVIVCTYRGSVLIRFETLKWGDLESSLKRNFWVCLNSPDKIALRGTESMNKKKSEKSSVVIYKGV